MRVAILIALAVLQQQRLAGSFRSENSAAGAAGLLEARDAAGRAAEPPAEGYKGARRRHALLLILASMGAACLVICAVAFLASEGAPIWQAARQRALADLVPEPPLEQACRRSGSSKPEFGRPKVVQWSWICCVLMFLVACACIAARASIHQGYNEVLKWATRHQCLKVVPGPFPDVLKPDLLVLQGRPKEMPFKLYTSSVFKSVRKLNTTFSPRPANRGEWECELIRTYRNVLDEYFASGDAPYVMTAEDDVEVTGSLGDLEDHIMSVLATVRDGFYSFQRASSDGTCSYRFGMQLLLIRREFVQELDKTCFNQCKVPIDICISSNWNFRMSQRRLIASPPSDVTTNPGR